MNRHNPIRRIEDLMARADSLESSLTHYDHTEGARIAAEARALRDRAQALIDRLPLEHRATWTRANRRTP